MSSTMALIMSGGFEVIDIKTGKRLVIQMDGTELRDQIPPPIIEWCDKGAHWAHAAEGKDVYGMLWQCYKCT